MTSESFAPGEASIEAGSDDLPEENVKKQRVLRDVALLLAKHEVRNLKRWFEEFDRDIMLPILLGEIALHNIGTPSAAATDGDEMPECTLKPCNAYSIAAATGLPRETVRRKVARLVELGWVSRRKNGHLYVSSGALRHFGHLLSSRELPDLIDTADCARRLLGD
jgi:NifB/MoaA-like Fe-S oxidoreductase